MPLILATAGAWICAAAGRLITGRMPCLGESPLERAVYSFVLGACIAAYGTLAIGLAGLLLPPVLAGWWLLLALVSVRGSIENGRDIQQFKPRTLHYGTAVDRWTTTLCLICILIAGICAAVLCFRPPAGHEWDVLAYHLADPKIFLTQHRIFSLPTEHHSNFPFVMEMLFTSALQFGGAPCAALAHLCMWLATAAGLIAFCSRRVSTPTGWLAAAVFSTTPLVMWEASSAYVDVAYGLFVMVGVFASVSATLDDRKWARDWCVLAGTGVGLALGSKYLALAPLALIALLLVYRRAPRNATIAYLVISLVIGSPWYVKNVVINRNPVYPFYYRLFPASRYWSADRAAAYQSEQDSFGSPDIPRGRASKSPLSLIQLPWNVLAFAPRYANIGDFTISVMAGGLYAAFCFALVFYPRVPRSVRDVLALALLQLVIWFYNAQIGRYIVSLLPLLAVPAAYAAAQLIAPGGASRLAPGVRRGGQLVSVGAVGGQALLFFWSLFGLPTSGRAAAVRGVELTSESVPEAIGYLTAPGGAGDELRRVLDVYAADEWINKNAAPGDGVILYDETRGYYLDRPYLWGNGEHSAYIPYPRMSGGADLTRWLVSHGIRYALINLKFSPRNGSDPELPGGPVGNEQVALDRWVGASDYKHGSWRALLAQSVASGSWTTVFAANGVVVMRIGDSGAGAGQP